VVNKKLEGDVDPVIRYASKKHLQKEIGLCWTHVLWSSFGIFSCAKNYMQAILFTCYGFEK
jgi:hypothetical protein